MNYPLALPQIEERIIEATDQESQFLRSQFSTLETDGRGRHTKHNPKAEQ